jgi:hypothetical protein
MLASDQSSGPFLTPQVKMSRRKRRTSDLDYSPPLRRKLADLTDTSSIEHSTSGSILPTSTGPHKALCIFSWNVNGIQPLLRRPISAFFPSKGNPAQKKPLSPLKSFLERHGWPQILCLQEVKITPSDTGTVRSIQAAIEGRDESPETACTAFFCLPSNRYNAKGFGGKIYGVAH